MLVMALAVTAIAVPAVSAEPTVKQEPTQNTSLTIGFGCRLAQLSISRAERMFNRTTIVLDKRDGEGRDTSQNREYLRQAAAMIATARDSYDNGQCGRAIEQASQAIPLLIQAILTTSPPPSLIIDVPAVDIEGDFLHNGNPFPASQYLDGTVDLRDEGGPDRVELGNTHDGSYAMSVVEGTYDVYYSHEQGQSVPQNVDAIVANDVVINTNKTLDVDVKSASVRSSFRLNNDPFPTSQYNTANFYLQNVNGGDPILLRKSHQNSGPVRVVQGTYDVIYSHQNGTLVPQNQNAVVMPHVVIAGDTIIDLNVVGVDLRTSCQLNDSPFPYQVHSSADFYLRDDTTRDLVYLGVSSGGGTHTNTVIPGDYDVVYKHKWGTGVLVPLNPDTVVDSISVVNPPPPEPYVIDVEAGFVTGQYTHNGGVFPGSIYQSAEFLLREVGTEDLILMGRSNKPSTPIMVTTGTYDVIFQHFNGPSVPQNEEAVVKQDVIVNEGNQDVDVDVSSVDITGNFKLNGGNFPVTIYQSAEIFLRPTGGEELILLGNTYQDPDPVKIVAGTYDVVYSHKWGPTGLPQNEYKVILNAVPLSISQVLDVNVESVTVKPTFKLNGGYFPASVYSSADFYLRDPDTDDMIYLGRSHAEADAISIVDGTYDVIYQIANGDQLPQNTHANFMSTSLG
jgi:hypothetical protein